MTVRRWGRLLVGLAFLPTLLLLAGSVRAVVADCGPLGAWHSYTPGWTSDGTQPTLGNGTLTGEYRLIDSLTMQVQLQWVRGSTGTNGTGTYQFGLPSGYAARSGPPQTVSARLLDSGTAHLAGIGYLDPGSTGFYAMIADNTQTGRNMIFQTGYPITLATGDQLNIAGVIAYTADCPAPTAAPTGTPGPTASAMTINEFTGPALAELQRAAYVDGLGWVVAIVLLAGLLVAAGLRR